MKSPALLRLENRFRVLHDAQTDVEVHICSGMVSFMAVLATACLPDYRIRTLKCAVMLAGTYLQITGTPAARAGRLEIAMAEEFHTHLEELLEEGKATGAISS